MTDAALDDDEDEDEAFYPTLAIPPLYVLRTAAYCPECGQAMHVYTLGCAAFRHEDDSRPVDVFHFLRLTRSVPPKLLTLLKRKCPGFFLDSEEGLAKPYLMNHCRCGAKLDDDYLHGDVGAAFWPDTPDGYRQFRLFHLPIEEPVPVESSYMIGGDEHLDYSQAEDW